MVIEIDLNETNTKSFNSGGLIQENAKSKFFNLINKLLLEIPIREDYKFPKNSFLRVHNTILINGKRGVGKTSFILSMMDALVDKLDICVLNIIDPTLIETKEHVFLNIITSIKDRVENYSKHAQNYHHDNNDSLREWKNSLKNLAGGLSILDGIGTNHLEDSMWDSPELILEKGLSNSKQGKDLEENFHKFIDESLKIIGSKAFFLVLDDIDTSLEKGISIMETLRKYLTSPKLIISILGDIDLYSILSRIDKPPAKFFKLFFHSLNESLLS
jgi:Cdc6-like AAA superfamily ATPase